MFRGVIWLIFQIGCNLQLFYKLNKSFVTFLRIYKKNIKTLVYIVKLV